MKTTLTTGGEGPQAIDLPKLPVPRWTPVERTSGFAYSEDQMHAYLIADRAARAQTPGDLPPFDGEWARYIAKGFQYGHHALEQVRFGYTIAAEALASRVASLTPGEPAGWQPIESAPRDPRTRILLRWLSGQSNWICIGAWSSSEDSPRLKVSGCPREGWMPDAGTCIPTNQKDCIGWMPLPAASTGER